MGDDNYILDNEDKSRLKLAMQEVQHLGLVDRLIKVIWSGKQTDVCLGESKGTNIAMKIYYSEKVFDYNRMIPVSEMAPLYALREYKILELLKSHGLDVPQPIAYNNNCFTMEFIGEPFELSPLLHYIDLKKQNIDPSIIRNQILKNIKTMWDLGIIHGDICDYNILFFNNTIHIIDFEVSFIFKEFISIPQIPLITVDQAKEKVKQDLDQLYKDFFIRCNLQYNIDDVLRFFFADEMK